MQNEHEEANIKKINFIMKIYVASFEVMFSFCSLLDLSAFESN